MKLKEKTISRRRCIEGPRLTAKAVAGKGLIALLFLILLGGSACGSPGDSNPLGDFFLFQALAGPSGPEIQEPPKTQTDENCALWPEFAVGNLPNLVQAGGSVSVNITVTKCGKYTDKVKLKLSTRRYGPYSSDPAVMEYEVPKEAGTYAVTFSMPPSAMAGTAYRLWASNSVFYPTPRSTNETAIPQTTNCTSAPGYKIEPISDIGVRGAPLPYAITVYRCGTAPRNTSVHLSSSNFSLYYSGSSLVESIAVPATTGTYDFTGSVPTSGTFTDGNQYFLGEPVDDVFSGNFLTYVVADASCTAPCSLTVNWDANREKAVNSTGGFYRVFYGTTENATETFQDVPYAGGGATPTTVNLNIASGGLRYIRMKAYSALNPAGSAAGTSFKLYAF